MKRIHGRKKGPLEFIKFQCERKGRKASFIAQRSGDQWHTYYNEPGPKSPCRILKLGFATIGEAEAYAKQQAESWLAGNPLQFETTAYCLINS